MLTRTVDAKKAEQALMYFANASGGRISYERAAHLLYVAERTMACQHHQVLADMNLLATRQGPVAGSILKMADDASAARGSEFSWRGPADALDELSVSDVRALESAFMTYGRLELADLQRQLRAFCTEWRMPLDPVEEISQRDMMMGLGLSRREAEEVEATMTEHAAIGAHFDKLAQAV